MTIHVNIGKAKSNLSRLIAAFLRGEEVVIDHDGVPQVKLTPVAKPAEADRAERRKAIDEVLARADALPRIDPSGGIEWDDNGLPA